MPGRYGQLTGEQAEHFRQRGFVTVRGAFDAASAQRWLDDAWIRFGYDRNDPGSWAEKRWQPPSPAATASWWLRVWSQASLTRDSRKTS